MLCRCRWIDSQGNETPDTYEAIGMAVCHNPSSFGEAGSIPFPICEEHAKLRSQWWRLYPLPGQSVEESHYLVQEDQKRGLRLPPSSVIASIQKTHPDTWIRIVENLKYSHMNGYWYWYSTDGENVKQLVWR